MFSWAEKLEHIICADWVFKKNLGESSYLCVSTGTSDYIAPTPGITFPASIDRMTIPITIVTDSILEDQESFSAQLRIASGSQQEGVIADSNITITITDDDS